MQLKGIRNHNYTNRVIKLFVIAGDFVVLWILLSFVVDFIPKSDTWDDGKSRTFWMISTLAMIMSEYWFSTVIHLRLMGSGEIMRRCTMLVLTQTVLSYMLLRTLHFPARLGWQLLFMGIVMLVVIILLRFVEHWILKRLRKLGYNMRMVTFIGSDQEIHRLYQKIICNPTYGYKLRSSYVSPSDFASQLSHPEELRLGDEVYLCVSRKERELIERTARLCHHRMVKFYYVPTTEEKLNLQPVLIDDMEVMATYTSPLEEPLNRLLKRLVDIFLSGLFLLLTAILLPFIALVIKLQSPGPVFFRQRRTGLNGREFYCFKFRSMHVNPDNDSHQTTKDDCRMFPFGRFMCRNNINELPQFWNVLRGNMSIVGPRPHLLSYTKQYEQLIDKYMVRHFVKPGITGWAQVTGFPDDSSEPQKMEDRVERDIWYIQHWSFWLDLRIMWLTIKFFKRNKKAYYG